MKKYMILSVLFLVYFSLQAGVHGRLLDEPSKAVQEALVAIAETSARESQAPDMAQYAQKSAEFYVHVASSGFHSCNKWYWFDGSQDAAQAIQQSATGRLTWYYRDFPQNPEK
jgi:hypothetical protein